MEVLHPFLEYFFHENLLESLDVKQKMVRRTFLPCPFTGPKMFCASPNYLSQPKNLTVLLSAFSKTFLLAQKQIY